MAKQFHIRKAPPELDRRYRELGLWVDKTLAFWLDEGLAASPRQTYRVWSQDRPWTGNFATIREQALRLAAGFVRLGVRPGDVVSFQLPNWLEGVVTFLATMYSGAVSLPIVQIYGAKELKFVLAETEAKLHVTVDRFRTLEYGSVIEAMRADLPHLSRVMLIDRDFPELLSGEPLSRLIDVEPDAPAMIGYTSGTTSDPKGVIHTHRTVVAEMLQRIQREPGDLRPIPLTPPPGFDRWLVGAPLGHVSGLQIGIFVPILFNKPGHLIDRWDIDVVLDLLTREDLYVGAAPNFFFNSIIRHPDFSPERHLRHLSYILSGGAPVPRSFGEQCEGMGVKLVRGYGSTEHPSVTGSAFDDPVDKRIGTDGRALSGVEIQMRDASGKAAPRGQAAEIWTRGPDLFVGYMNANLNAECFDEDGWFCMGDVGILDDDGFLAITDRTKDIIIRGGENISALEVEDALCRMDGIAEAAAVAAPDERLGERVCAFIRLVQGAPSPDISAVKSHLSRVGLARQKWPEELRFVDDFERTPAGKVKKFMLRDALRSEAAERHA